MQSRIKIIIVFVVVYLTFLHSISLHAQSRMVMNNNAFLVIDNSAKLVVDNSNSNAIITTGTGGNLVTRNEFDQVKWIIGGLVGTWSLPFTTVTGVKIPFSLNVSVPGNSGFLNFSTYKGSSWDNSTYLPSDVTHINNSSGSNNSASVMDRFWIMEPETPDVSPFMGIINFGYDDAEHSAVGNTITEANLVGQRFNSDLNTWGDYIPAGTANTAANTVTSVSFNGNFYRSWTLVESDNPMPVELVSFEYECHLDQVELKWTTVSETNNMYFKVESSNDGIVFVVEQIINGAGNSNMSLNYSAWVNGNKYYRLTQTDFNGATEEIGNLYANCMEENELVYWQAMEKLSDIRISGLDEGELVYQLFDMSGKLIVDSKISVASGTQQISLPEFPNGMYTIHFKNNDKLLSGKVMMVK